MASTTRSTRPTGCPTPRRCGRPACAVQAAVGGAQGAMCRIGSTSTTSRRPARSGTGATAGGPVIRRQ
eukprot:14949569-Alexandrium_andersonii.AAC.1